MGTLDIHIHGKVKVHQFVNNIKMKLLEILESMNYEASPTCFIVMLLPHAHNFYMYEHGNYYSLRPSHFLSNELGTEVKKYV